MSRTFKSKEAQQVHNTNKYTKAFGYDYVFLSMKDVKEFQSKRLLVIYMTK